MFDEVVINNTTYNVTKEQLNRIRKIINPNADQQKGDCGWDSNGVPCIWNEDRPPFPFAYAGFNVWALLELMKTRKGLPKRYAHGCGDGTVQIHQLQAGRYECWYALNIVADLLNAIGQHALSTEEKDE